MKIRALDLGRKNSVARDREMSSGKPPHTTVKIRQDAIDDLVFECSPGSGAI